MYPSGRPNQPPPPVPTVMRPNRPKPQRSYVNYGIDGPQNGSMPDSIGARSRSVSSSSRPDIQTSIPPTPQPITKEGENVKLDKQVGLISGVSLILGTMIGSGIFISTRGVMQGAGSVGFSLILWAACGIISLCGALCLAELGTMIPKSGGEYPYLMEAFVPFGRFGKIPAFLFAWVVTLVLKPSACAITVLGSTEYLLKPFIEDRCGSTASLTMQMLAITTILVVSAVNIYSVRLASRVQVVLSVVKVSALLVIIIGGVVMLAKGNVQHLSSGFENTESNPGKIAIAVYNSMWAYDGWNNLNYVTEEIINPNRNIPLSIIIAVPLVTILYLLVNISYLSVMSVAEIIESPAVAVTWAENTWEPLAWFIPFAVALSAIGSANGTLFGTGRLTYVAAREGHMMEVLSMIHVKRHTPLPSLVFTALISCIMVMPGNISSLIDFFSFAIWFFYALTMVALLIMRWTKKDTHRPYKVPIVIPILVLVVSLFLVLVPIIDNPQVEFLYAFIFIIAGLIFYFPFVHFKFVIPGTTAITTFAQLLMEVAPASNETEIAG